MTDASIEMPISFAKALAKVAPLIALAGCGEWNAYLLVNPETKQSAACAVPWGELTHESNQRLHQCIEICEQKGFKLRSPESVPAPTAPVVGAKPPSVPIACQK